MNSINFKRMRKVAIFVAIACTPTSQVFAESKIGGELSSTTEIKGGVLNAAIGKSATAKTNVNSIKNSKVGGDAELELNVTGGVLNAAIGKNVSA